MNKKLYLIGVMFLFLIVSSASVHAETALTGWGAGYINWGGVTANSYYGIIFTSDGGGMNQSIINITTNHGGSTFSRYRVYINGNTEYIPQRACANIIDTGTYRTCVFGIPANFTTEVVNMSITLSHTAAWTFAYWSPTFPYNNVGPFNILTSWNNGNNGPRYDEAYPIYSLGYENMTAVIPPTANFSITAYNSTTTSQLLSYTASINGSTYNSDGGGLINTTLATTNGGIYPLTIDAFGFYNYSANVNISTNWRANLTQFNILFNNQYPTNLSQYNYSTSHLNVSITYNGDPTTTHFNLTIDDVITYSTTSSSNNTITKTNYTNLVDGYHTYNWTVYNDYITLQTNPYIFYIDTSTPNITTNFVNNSIYYINNNQTFNVNFTHHTSIWEWNISLDGVQIYSNSSVLGNNSFDYSYYTNTTGKHTLLLKTRSGVYRPLNSFEKEYYFYVFNHSLTYNPTILEGTNQTSYILFDYGSTDYNASNVTQIFDGTKQTVVYSPFPATNKYQVQYFIPATGTTRTLVGNWTFNISNTYYTTSYNQYVSAIGVNNCSNASWPKAITFVFFDEVNRSATAQLADTTLNMHMNIWTASPTSFVELNFSFKGRNNYSICIDPPGASYNVSTIMQYYNPGYATRNYYILQIPISNQTQTIPLYNIMSSIGNIIQTKTYDQASSLPVPNTYVSLLRYYPETNTYATVEIEQSDVNGFSIFTLVPYNTFYRFVVNYQNNIVLTTNPETIYTGTKSLPVVLSTSYLKSLQYINEVMVNVSCNPTTSTCSFFWADTNNLVQYAQFDVYRLSGWGKELIYTQTEASTSGSMFYTITENMTGKSYQAVGSIETNTRGSFFTVDTANLLSGSTYGRFGTIGGVLYSGMFLILVMSLVVIDIGPYGVIIGSGIGLLAGALFGLIPLTWAGVLAIVVIMIGMLYKSKS